MMSLAQIREHNRAATRAVNPGKVQPWEPLTVDAVDWVEAGREPVIPYVGEKVPKGWAKVEAVDDLFVDKSGYGSESEPAMTQRAFFEWVRESVAHGYGYAIVEDGPFQCYVGVFVRKPSKGKRK